MGDKDQELTKEQLDSYLSGRDRCPNCGWQIPEKQFDQWMLCRTCGYVSFPEELLEEYDDAVWDIH